MNEQNKSPQGLYDPRFEHDGCGIGAVVSIDGIKTHDTVDRALKIVEKLEHRAGKDATGETGDGVGIMTQIPHRFFSEEAVRAGISLGNARDYGVGMLFFPQDELQRKQAMKMLEIIVEKEGLSFLGWREVPIESSILSDRARRCMPKIMQCFITRPRQMEQGVEFERRLYIVRRTFEQSNDSSYVVSLSSKTIVYKGMFLVSQLRRFYLDLDNELYESALALVHSRFSTNTNPSWERAHPNRVILHNGEINTIRGNVDRMMAREETMRSRVMSPEDTDKVLPVVNEGGSDSAMLDNTLEFLLMNGIDLPLAVMMTIPEPWKNNADMDQDRRDMYHYYATMMEPWDGPASILFSDGDLVGAVLDRNGLRPSRYYITDDKYLILSSEVGVLPIPAGRIVQKRKLQPGRMLLVDTVRGALIEDEDLKNRYAQRNPYGEWLDRCLVHLEDISIPNKRLPHYPVSERQRLYKTFGYTYEDIKTALLPMAQTGSEPTASMGVDTPLAVLSEKRQPLFNYFKQLFAQVTNPPIDAIREDIVTDTSVYVGSDGNLLEDVAENCTMLQINNPILTGIELLKIKSMKNPAFKVETVSLLYYKNTSLRHAIDRLFVTCDRAYKNGANIIILSDRGVDENHVAIPSLLAVSALEQYLIRTKKRTAISVILESAEPREVHHFATLLGYGARAINPYLAHECIVEMIEDDILDKDAYAAIDSYNDAVLHGIMKIASKMGISTLQSYQSAQIFEIIGINEETVEEFFANTVSRIGGIGISEMAEDVEFRHNQAFDPLGLGSDISPDSIGSHKLRSGENAEDHLYDPEAIYWMQRSVKTGDYDAFKKYSNRIDDEKTPHTIRSLLTFDFDSHKPISLEDVEPVGEIVTRFKTGAMSYGSISQEAHETLALAMNRLGGKSNSGEGGEQTERLRSESRSKIKQVASGRFGVTGEYLLSADEIQIKMAQGAKPGEGGHLPGEKVYPWIAKTRHSTSGVSLISPPPHHDIYSIEDLAQLIFDLKNANRKARISVKLASEAGVGTVAAGVAKAGAQVILIAGYDGGTGAASRTSIHNAGLPWELGLAEAHQTLIQNDLRSRVILETDGKLMTGRDIAIACALGAEEFGFATAPLIAMGCMMMRVCNLDTCPVGIATQNPELRGRFCGKPEQVITFMEFVAQELREIMSRLGIKTVDEFVGRVDLLKVDADACSPRAALLDFDALLRSSDRNVQHLHFQPEKAYDFNLSATLDEKILLKKLAKQLDSGTPAAITVKTTSTDRALGTIFGSEITRRYGNSLSEDTFVVTCQGSGGQSLGAFIPQGLTIVLEGDSNDYFGKGLSGGKLVVYPPKAGRFKAEENIIIGNVAFYGATSGNAFINGIAGERFCVRNSGASIVVEGVGDHGCEYMTGGRVVILGETGRNFAAGMSGGIAYVLDPNHSLYKRVNKEQVSIDEVSEKHHINELRDLITRHVKATGSPKGKHILADFDAFIPRFKLIIPHDYRRILKLQAQMEKKGMTKEQAQIEAFYLDTREQKVV